jgi:peptide/nickel transport system ATP-binding protein
MPPFDESESESIRLPLLGISGLHLRFRAGAGFREIISDLSLSIFPGEVVALVGESGSGKSLTAASIMRLLPSGAEISAGSIRFGEADLLDLSESEMDKVRGARVAMLYQQPRASFDPTSSIGTQVGEAFRVSRKPSRALTRERSIEMLGEVGIPEPARIARAHAHQLSGGMAQRAMIAAALSSDPELIIADEATTALDATVQAQILKLLMTRRRETKLAILLISHDLAMVSSVADRVYVMYAGRIVEDGTVEQIMGRPEHPYTRALLSTSTLTLDETGRLVTLPGSPTDIVNDAGCRFLPRCGVARSAGVIQKCEAREPPLIDLHSDRHVRCWAPQRAWPAVSTSSAALVSPVKPTDVDSTPLVVADGVTKHFTVRTGFWGRRTAVHAVDDVSLSLQDGEALGLVGETGSGKSTLGRLLLGLVAPDSGKIEFDGKDIGRIGKKDNRALRRHMQIVFQDPQTALDPRMTLGSSVGAPLSQHHMGDREARRARILELLAMVGLSEQFASRLPSQCSGGQLQRVVIARALALNPRFLVCDEPTASLDAPIRAQIINVLSELRERLGLTLLVISHHLDVVRHLCDRVAVMYLGQIVECADVATIFESPRHPYTRQLVASSSTARRSEMHIAVLEGEPPSPTDPPHGCRFQRQCPLVVDECRSSPPPLAEVVPGHVVACHRWQAELPQVEARF